MHTVGDGADSARGWLVRTSLIAVAGGRRGIRTALAVVTLLAVVGCVHQVEPDPAVIRDTPPPWEAPRDAIAYIEAAGLEAQPLETTQDSHTIDMIIIVDNMRVPIPAYVGIDRLRAQRAAVHTHDTTNKVWLEGRGVERVTLGQFFAVWGVRFDARCLGAACTEVAVTADGERVSDPAALLLASVNEVEVFARS